MENILRENGFADEGLTREGLERLRALLIKHEKGRSGPHRRAAAEPRAGAAGRTCHHERGARRARHRSHEGVGGALRHGVLYDLLGRVQHRDMREATVTQFVRRYHIDAAQAKESGICR